jgi:hypothetical protein
MKLIVKEDKPELSWTDIIANIAISPTERAVILVINVCRDLLLLSLASKCV